MPKIFISYRREDSAYAADLIYEGLVIRFGRDAIFMDIDTIPYGDDFRVYIGNAVEQCDVVLVIIGEEWLTITSKDGPNKGKRRLENANDFVRLEIEAALARDIPVIPVLVERAEMPPEEELPPSLRPLRYRNAAEVRAGRDFPAHRERLFRALEERFPKESERVASSTVASAGDTSSSLRLNNPIDASRTDTAETATAKLVSTNDHRAVG